MSTIQDLIEQNIPDNNQKLITEAKLREVLHAMADKLPSAYVEEKVDIKIISEFDQNADWEQPLSVNASDIINDGVGFKGIKREIDIEIDGVMFDPSLDGVTLVFRQISLTGLVNSGVFQNYEDSWESGLYQFSELIDNTGAVINGGGIFYQNLSLNTPSSEINYSFNFGSSNAHRLRFENKEDAAAYVRTAFVFEADTAGNMDIKELNTAGVPNATGAGDMLVWSELDNDWKVTDRHPMVLVERGYSVWIKGITYDNVDKTITFIVGGNIQNNYSSFEIKDSLGNLLGSPSAFSQGTPNEYSVTFPFSVFSSGANSYILEVVTDLNLEITNRFVVDYDTVNEELLGFLVLGGFFNSHHFSGGSTPLNYVEFNCSISYAGTLAPNADTEYLIVSNKILPSLPIHVHNISVGSSAYFKYPERYDRSVGHHSDLKAAMKVQTALGSFNLEVDLAVELIYK